MTDLRKQRAERFRNTDLYLVIGHEFTNGRSVLDVLAAAADGGVRTVQLREKNLSGKELTLLAEKFRRKCEELGVLMIMNDHVDIAASSGKCSDITAAIAALHHFAAVVVFLHQTGVRSIVITDFIREPVLVIVTADMHIIAACPIKHAIPHKGLIINA